MEIRKVQVTGGSSYVITLPKEWIKSSNIKKNDSLGITIQSDGTLLITPKMIMEQIYKEKQINSDIITQKSFLLRRLIAAYISGYNSIKVTSEKRLSPEIRSTVRVFSQTAIGQEIVEETDKSITVKDLLNPLEMPFDKTIKRMHIIVKGMHEDTLHTMKHYSAELIKEIISRDQEVDRLHWLIARQYNSIMQNMSLAEKMETTIELSSTFFLISRIIERIGDHVVKIADNIINLQQNITQSDIIHKIETASTKAQEIFSQSIGSFYRKDITASNKNIETVDTLHKFCEEIDKLALQQKGLVAISIGNIVESIRRIGEYSQDISENVINYLIKEEKNLNKQSQTKPPL